MHRSSEPIGAIAAALAKAQSKLINPEKSLVGNHRAFVAARLRASFPLSPLSAAEIRNAAAVPWVRSAVGSARACLAIARATPVRSMQHGRTYLEQRSAPKSALASI
jgi:hypothetical protein